MVNKAITDHDEMISRYVVMGREEVGLLPDEERRAVEWCFQQEVRMCQGSFLRFLRWCKVVEAPIPGQSGGGVTPLVLWGHTKVVVASLLKDKMISVLKARQIGLSTIISAYVLWYAMCHVGGNVLLFSKGQPEAKELLAKSRRIWESLPYFLRLKLDPDSTEELGFTTMKSSIKAFPSTASAGISYTASIVVCDEHAEHPYADENYLSTKPTRDKGGQFISIFTADPYSNDNLATVIFNDALEGKNDFRSLFFPYDVMPGRDDAWYEATKRNIPERDIAKLSPALYMAKNYPKSIEEALGTIDEVAPFEKRALNAMMEDTRFPVLGLEGVDASVCNIYKDYHVGNYYVAASDVSHGLMGDYSVTCILDVKTGDVVADIMTRELKPEDFAEQSVELLKHYHNPLWWVENNITGGGREVIKKAVELGYRKLGYRGEKAIRWSDIDDNETLKRVGFFTGERERADMFGQLIPAINDLQMRIYSKEGLKQFYNIVRNSRKNGKIEATSSMHDDYVIAVGFAWLYRKQVLTGGDIIKPIDTLSFGGKAQNLGFFPNMRGL